MQINMTTFGGRPTHYIHQTLESLFASDWQGTDIPINLIMGSADESYLQEYASHPSIRIVSWDVETDPELRVNATLNKIRALRCGDDEETLIVEDDITFLPNWLACLKAAAAELAGVEYVLSLFAATPLLNRATFVEGKHLVKRYPTYFLQGAQAIFYPRREIRQRAADFLTTNLRRACGDDLIGRFARSSAVLYATKEILVDHIGAVTCFEI